MPHEHWLLGGRLSLSLSLFLSPHFAHFQEAGVVPPKV